MLFQIKVMTHGKKICLTIVDERTSDCVMSFKCWKAFGSPLSVVEVSYQATQIASADSDQNIPLMEEYDSVTWPIWAMGSPSSHDFLDYILSSNEYIPEVVNIWLYPPKIIFRRATGSILDINLPKYRSMICIFLDLIWYIWKLAYRFRPSLCEDAFEPFATQTCHRVEPIGNWWVSPSYFYFPPF